MNALLRIFLVLLALPAARAALAQPALDRVEQQLKRQIRAEAGQTPAAADGQQPGYLGVVADDRQDRGRGARLMKIVTGGPAAQAGLKVNDLMTAVDDQPVRELDDMTHLLELRPAGAVVMFTVNRDGEERSIAVTLAERPEADKRLLPQFGKQPEGVPPAAGAAPADNLILTPSGPKLGIRTLPISPEAQQQLGLTDAVGALVSYVGPGSPAEKAGLPLGAVIVAVDGQGVDGPETLAGIVRQAKIGQTVDLSCIIRGQEQHKRVVLAAMPTAIPPQVRAKPAPSETAMLPPPGFAPQALPSNGVPAADDDRIQMLERRIAELEERLEKLEAQQADK